MRGTAISALLLLSVAACGPAPQPAVAPGGAEGAGAISPAALEPPPVHALIGHRQTLGLNSEQVTALDSIGQHLHSENQPHMRRVSEMRERFRGRAGRDPRGGESLPGWEEGRVAMEQIRQNNREAAEGVRQLLDEDQRARTCDLFRDADRRRQRVGQPGAGASRQAPRRTGATAPAAQERIWPWCGEQAAPATTVTADPS
jgi:hypothetical protein